MGEARVTNGVLSHGHLFGLKSDVRSNIYFIDEHVVAYPCGHSIVLLHLETRAQQVGGEQTEESRQHVPVLPSELTSLRHTVHEFDLDCPLLSVCI